MNRFAVASRRALVLAILSGSGVSAAIVPRSLVDEWPGWRGPTGGGVAVSALPASIAAPEHLAWRAEIPGRGLCSPIVVGEHVYLTTALSTGPAQGAVTHPDMLAPSPQEFRVLCLRRDDGTVVWQETLAEATPHQGMHSDATYASPTMVSDGEHLAASFGSFGVHVLSLDGELRWQVDLGDLDIREAFGEGSSPALKDGVLVQLFDHEGESFIVAHDIATGEELWRQPRPRGTNWTTPLIVEVDGSYQVIVGAERVAAYDLHVGDEIWWLGEWPEEDYSVPRPRGAMCVMSSPVAAGDLVFVSRGERLGVHAISLLDADGDLAEGDAVRWICQRDVPEVSSPLVHGDIVYMVKANQGLVTALDAATGEKRYGPTRLKGIANVYASPVAAGDLVFLAGRDGEVEVLQAGPTFESLAVHRHEDRFDASPAVAGNQLFLRGRNHLYCFESGDADH